MVFMFMKLISGYDGEQWWRVKSCLQSFMLDLGMKMGTV